MTTVSGGSSGGGASVPLTPPALAGNQSFAVSIALLVIRLALGWTFIYHGSQKLFGAFGGIGGLSASEGIKAFSGYLQGMPVLSPLTWAYIAGCGEFFGGVSIFLGLLARLGAIPIIVTMFVAIARVHGPLGFSHSNPPGYELNTNLIAMAAAIMIAGPGLISLDALLFKRGLWVRGPQPLGTPGVRA